MLQAILIKQSTVILTDFGCSIVCVVVFVHTHADMYVCMFCLISFA